MAQNRFYLTDCNMSPGVLKEILDTLAGTAESYRGLERGLECGFSQRYCHERLLDNDQTR